MNVLRGAKIAALVLTTGSLIALFSRGVWAIEPFPGGKVFVTPGMVQVGEEISVTMELGHLEVGWLQLIFSAPSENPDAAIIVQMVEAGDGTWAGRYQITEKDEDGARKLKYIFAALDGGFPTIFSSAESEPEKVYFVVANPARKWKPPSLEGIKGHWAEKKILSLAEEGVVQGYPDQEFRPDQPVTRAEFVVMVLNLLKIPVSARATALFPDVEGHWAKPAIAEAYDKALVHGYPDGSFRPENPIRRAEVVTILASAIENRGFKIPPFRDWADISRWLRGDLVAPAPSGFTDIGQHWARASIEALARAKIIEGYPDGTFRPDLLATRAEASSMLQELMNLVR